MKKARTSVEAIRSGTEQAIQLARFAFDGLRFVLGGPTVIALIAAYIILLMIVVLGLQFVLRS